MEKKKNLLFIVLIVFLIISFGILGVYIVHVQNEYNERVEYTQEETYITGTRTKYTGTMPSHTGTIPADDETTNTTKKGDLNY